jgi:hypothetical protein
LNQLADPTLTRVTRRAQITWCDLSYLVLIICDRAKAYLDITSVSTADISVVWETQGLTQTDRLSMCRNPWIQNLPDTIDQKLGLERSSIFAGVYTQVSVRIQVRLRLATDDGLGNTLLST